MTSPLVKLLFGNKTLITLFTLSLLVSCASKHDIEREEENQYRYMDQDTGSVLR